ncbi:MAG: DUF3466 family protein, partial [Planctomycetes bacterium]|nr:DUF3466 family protein [Planctomycetota bacterium]
MRRAPWNLDHSVPRTITIALALALVATFAHAQAPQPTKWGEDTDGDGKDDHFYQDLDSDGKVDICEIDLDEDGNFETRWVDDDDDGDWDTRQDNPNDDTKQDSGKSDTNGDGKFDMKWTDNDGDGAIDFDEIQPIDPEDIPPGPMPNETPPSGTIDCVAPGCVFPTAPVGLGGYLPFAFYTFTPTAPTLAQGYFTALGRCGQLAGQTQSGGIPSPALSIGGTTQTIPTSGPGFAFSVSSNNSMVGMAFNGTGFAPMFIPADEPIVMLPTLGGNNGQAYDLDDALTLIVGGSSDNPSSFTTLPTVWQLFGGPGAWEPVPYALPTLSSTGGSANAVNGFGWIAGSSVDLTGQSRAVLWTGEPGSYGLIDLGPGVATDVNDHGLIVGTVDLLDGTTRGFVSDGTSLTVLKSPIGCDGCSQHAVSINEHGEIVGWIELPSGDTAPLYWPSADGIPIDLR